MFTDNTGDFAYQFESIFKSYFPTLSSSYSATSTVLNRPRVWPSTACLPSQLLVSNIFDPLITYILNVILNNPMFHTLLLPARKNSTFI